MKGAIVSASRPKLRVLSRRGIPPGAVRVLSVLIGLVLWEAYGRVLSSAIFTYPTAIAQAFITLVSTGELQFYLKSSLTVLSLGLLLAIVVGIVLGILLARKPILEHIADAYISALYATPTVALIPVIVLWLGFQTQAKVALVFLFCVFPILINTHQGVRNVDSRLMEVARSFCSRERDLWRHLILPSTAPFILAGIRLAIGRGLVGMIVAEFYTSITGLGYMIVQYANTFKTDRLFVPIVLLMLMGIGLTAALRQLERRITPWLHLEAND